MILCARGALVSMKNFIDSEVARTWTHVGQPVMKNLSPMGETRDPARAWGNLWDQLVPFTPGALQARGATAHYLGIWCPWAPGALQARGATLSSAFALDERHLGHSRRVGQPSCAFAQDERQPRDLARAWGNLYLLQMQQIGKTGALQARGATPGNGR